MRQISTNKGSSDLERNGARSSSQPALIAINGSRSSALRFRGRRRTRRGALVAPETQMGLFQASVIAVVSLLFVAAVALGSMIGSAALLHLISPSRHFDVFRALHEPGVVGVLIGLAVLWLLPPHPWAVKPAKSEPKSRRSSSVKAVA